MEEEIEIKDETASDTSLPRVRQPRPAWQESVLFVLSFTLLTSFWLVGRVRDLKAVGNIDFTPWLWFFVPFIPLAQIIGLPRFFDELKRREDGSTTRQWKSYTWAWIAVLVVTNIIVLTEDSLNLPEWVLEASLIIICGLFALLHIRFNNWKHKLEKVEFYGKASGYYWYEWLVVVLGSIVFIAYIYFYVLAPLFIDKIQDLEDRQVIENSDLGFGLTIAGDGWVEVEAGTHSSDETELELSGPTLGSFFIVFDQGLSNSLNGVASGRATLRNDFSGSPVCKENRYLSNNEKSVISYTECNGSWLDEKVTTYSTIIISNDRTVELYGYLMDSKHKHARQSENMRTIAKSFSPL